MADGILKVGTITNSQGSGNITIGSGVTLLSNVPAFQAYLSSNQSGLSDAATVLAQLNTTALDTDNAFDTSTYTFTCPVAGKYFVYGKFSGLPVSTARESSMWVYKNGSEILSSVGSFVGSSLIINDGSTWSHPQTSGIVTLAVNDTLKLYGKMNTNSSTWSFVSGITETTLGAYRIGA
ncbi:hypothetical protein N9003_01095 [bacterium]|nr:hypothetical protein [bacterium]